MTHKDAFSVLEGEAASVARRLLGCELERELDGQVVRVRIVETEAYDQTDAASHSYNGRTPRTDIMFGPAGHLYVYFTYGMHYCANVTVGEEGYGAAVLIRAAEPLVGETELEKRRGRKRGVELINGPAKLCQALGINKQMNGHDLHREPVKLIITKPIAGTKITAAKRVGISKAKDVLWRFYLTDSSYVSVK